MPEVADMMPVSFSWELPKSYSWVPTVFWSSLT